MMWGSAPGRGAQNGTGQTEELPVTNSNRSSQPRTPGDAGEGVHAVAAPAQGGNVMTEETLENSLENSGVSRRTLLRWGAVGGLGAGVVVAQGVGAPFLSSKGLLSPDG